MRQRPKQQKFTPDELKERMERFWDTARAELSWWTKEYGPAVGGVMFWQLAETQWLYDTLVKGWEPTQEWLDDCHAEAELMDHWNGNTDGLWVTDAPVKVVPMTYQDPSALENTVLDFSWITYVVPEECPF